MILLMYSPNAWVRLITGRSLVISGTSVSSTFFFLEHFPLSLKVLDHCVPQDVGSGNALFGGLIVFYYFTRSKELLLGICSEYKGCCWDRCPGCCIWCGVWDPASRASKTVCNLLYFVFIKVNQIVKSHDPLVSQLHYHFVRHSHLCKVLKEIRCLIIC